MATYLKNTYVDGTLVVEGALKAKNIIVSEASSVFLGDVHSPGRLTRFNDSDGFIQNSNIAIEDTLIEKENPEEKSSHIITVSIQPENPIVSSLEDFPSRYELHMFASNPNSTNEENVYIDSSAYTVTSLDEVENSITRSQAATLESLTMMMLPVKDIYLWNKTGASNFADNKWHFVEQ